MRCFLLFSMILLARIIEGQPPVRNPRYENPLWLVNLNYISGLPLGSLAKRYGFVNDAGMSVHFKTKKNILYGVSGGFLFGRNVRGIDYVNFLKDNNGYIFSDDGTPVLLAASMRGGRIEAVAGKLFPVFPKRPQMALEFQFGAGFLQHKYLFSAPNTLQFSSSYLRGYDRLSNGLALSQEAGLYYMSLNRMVNFNISIYATEAFVKNRRYYDYATGSIDNERYTDVILGLKFSWMLPIKPYDKDEPVYFK